MSLTEAGTTVGSWSPRVAWLSPTILVTAHTHPNSALALGEAGEGSGEISEA